MANFGEMWNLQSTENARKDKVKPARKKMQGKEFERKMESVRNEICKKWILQENRLTSKGHTFLNC